MNNLTDWNDLPLGLNAKQVSSVLGLSMPLVYNLINQQGFPSIKVSEKRWVIPKEHLKTWLENQALKNQ